MDTSTTNKRYIIKKDFSLKKEILSYLVYWKWFACSVFICMIIAALFLKKSNPIFNSETTILIKEAEGSRGISELAAFKDFDILEGSNDKNNEVEIIKSKSLLSRVVDSLDLNIIQTSRIGFRNVDIYDISPIKVKFLWSPLGYREKRKAIKKIKITLLSASTYHFVYEKEGGVNDYRFGEAVNLEQGVLVVDKSIFFESNQNLESKGKQAPIVNIDINIFPKNYYTSEISKALVVVPKNKRSNIINVSIKHANGVKANDLLDNLVYQYNKDAMEDKNLVAVNTDKFINERISIISKELDIVERNKVKFKKDNNFTDIKSESEIFVQEISDSQKKISDLTTQLDMTDAMIVYLMDDKRTSDLLPTNIGIESSGINSGILEYNKSVLDRNKLLLENATSHNPLVISLESNIKSQKNNLIESLRNQKRSLQITQNDFIEERKKMISKIRTIPKIEKDFLDIERQQNTKQNLYLFLLKKREENSISMAVTTPVAKIIDKSSSSNKPVFPKPIVILAMSLVLGLGIPFVVVYLKKLFDTKVNTRLDIQNILKEIPILGEVVKLKNNENASIGLNDSSVLGESFRIIRTNFNYFAGLKKQKDKALRVFVTSTIKGEGKTFISFNTALSLADANQKVLIVGGDIRAPELGRYLGKNRQEKGLTDYLYDKNCQVHDIVKQIEFEGRKISYIPAGRTPPNPSELLMNGRLPEAMDVLEKEFDVIVVDTTPTMLVADTLLMANTADVTMYVVRAGYTEKELLLHAREMHKEGKIKNMAVILNDVKQSRSGYGYGYGYNQHIAPLNIFKKILNKF